MKVISGIGIGTWLWMGRDGRDDEAYVEGD